ncbi:response regulator transcription factor [Geodermatophilus sp. SYSU D01176]
MAEIEVTPDQVLAARIEVQALETAGLEPEPLVRQLAAAGSARSVLEVLTSREHQVADLVAEGLRTDEIAKRLSMNPQTVNEHLDATLGKLDLPSTVELIILINREGPGHAPITIPQPRVAKLPAPSRQSGDEARRPHQP